MGDGGGIALAAGVGGAEDRGGAEGALGGRIVPVWGEGCGIGGAVLKGGDDLGVGGGDAGVRMGGGGEEARAEGELEAVAGRGGGRRWAKKTECFC